MGRASEVEASGGAWADPASRDPAPRFLGPRGRPTILAERATSVLEAIRRPERLDAVSAWRVLALAAYDVERGLQEGVGLVPMHHVVARDDGGVLRVAPGTAPGCRRATEAEAIRLVREVVVTATTDAVRPARRVAILLSSGTDSGAVAAALRAAWRALDRDPADLLAVHVRPPVEAGPGEEEGARASAMALGLPFHTQTFDACPDPFAGCDDFFRENDLPSDDGGFAPARARLEALRDLGFDTILTGDGGDEVFAGWWMRPWRRNGRWASAAALAEHGARALARPWRNALRGRRGAWERALAACGVPPWLADRCPSIDEPRTYPRTRPGLRLGARRREASTRCARQSVLASWWRAWGHVLGLRIACPLLDPRVLDLAVALPQRRFLPRPLERGLLRGAFAEDLPAAAGTRPKQDGDAMGILQREVATHGRDWLERYVAGGTLERVGLGPGPHAEGLVREAATGAPAAIYRVLAFASLGAWCRARAL